MDMTAHIGAPATCRKGASNESPGIFKDANALAELAGAAMNKWTRRLELSSASAGATAAATASLTHHYFAFISYSHANSADADWLHQELERFRVPSALAGRLTANGVIPKRLTPIFRDRHELAAGESLTEEIRVALTASRSLIVLCSPAAAKSKWTNAEIESFKRMHPDGCVIAAIVAGEPGGKGDDCFPAALTQRYDRRGRPTGRHAEPLAADLRPTGDGRRSGLLKVVAGILGIGLDDLVQREQLRRQRRLAIIAVSSLVGMLIAIALAIIAVEARDSARDERRQAEGLIGFMLGDLKDKLEPIGRLDALDGVGTRVLAYYQQQDKATLSDPALSQRSRALSLVGEVAVQRGDLDGARRLYGEAMSGTAEEIRRNPDDPQGLFDHAQNVFWVGQIAIYKGSLTDADRAFREYKRLADRMVELDPNSIKWRMEVYNADANLGGLLSQERRFPEASAQWDQVYRMISALTTADPDNREYRQSLVESLAWFADAERDVGHLDNAVALRERNVALLSQMAAPTGDIAYAQKLIPAERSLGLLYSARGQRDLALAHFRAAADRADRVILTEPNNTKSAEFGFKAKLDLAATLLLIGSRDDSRSVAEAVCGTVTRLLSKDPTVPEWRAGLRDCWLLRAQLAMAAGDGPSALQLAGRAIAVGRTVKTTDSVRDAYALARAFRWTGDIRRNLGDRDGAKAAWSEALRILPVGTEERPSEMDERAIILGRLGRSSEARPILAKLSSIGFKQGS
jgi:tetratricopeptide (TPR) repeat protein